MDHNDPVTMQTSQPAAPRAATPRAGQSRLKSPGANGLAATAAGISADSLARALETRSTAARRAKLTTQALVNREAALRYARAKAILAQKARAERAAAGLPELAETPDAPIVPKTRFGLLCQHVAKRTRRIVRQTVRRAQDAGWRTVACAGMTIAALLVIRHDAALWVNPGKPGNPGSPAYQLLSAKEWFQQAQDRAGEGNFRRALGTVKYALASTPKNVAQLIFEGDMHQSLFEFAEAQRAYEQALHLDSGNRDARQNLVLCRRLNRYRDDASSHRSTLYGLHRVMLGQRRVSEAVAISHRLKLDHALRQATWQAALDGTGLLGKITVDDNGDMAADLSGNLQPKLALLKTFPINALNLADTGLEDIHALKGMPLKSLDLSRTLVYDLSPLRGMALQTLRIRGTGVVELSAIAGCPLRELDTSDTRVGDLSPLVGMPLNSLRASHTAVADLRPLAALPLTRLDLNRTRVSDLQPLGNLGLLYLALDGTRVTDLSPLKGCPLRELHLSSTAVSDLRPLAEMPLTNLALSDCVGAVDMRPLVSCAELEHLHVPPHPKFLDRLAVLPRLRFIQHDETKLEDMMLLTGSTEPTGSRLEDMMLVSSRGEIATPVVR